MEKMMALALAQARLAAAEGETFVERYWCGGIRCWPRRITGGKRRTIPPGTRRSSACGRAGVG